MARLENLQMSFAARPAPIQYNRRRTMERPRDIASEKLGSLHKDVSDQADNPAYDSCCTALLAHPGDDAWPLTEPRGQRKAPETQLNKAYKKVR